MSEIKQIQILRYNELFDVPFYIKDNAVYLHATKIAEQFGKLVYNWTKSDQAQEIIHAISRATGIQPEDLVVASKENANDKYKGSWMHEDVALPFAQWLSPDFYVWCNARIKELLHHGITAVNPADLIDNPENTILLLQVIIKERKAIAELAELNKQQELQNIALAEINKQQEDLIELTKPKANYYDQVLATPDLVAPTVIAKELGLTAPKLNNILSLLRVQYKVGNLWVLYKEHLNKGWVGTNTFVHTNSIKKVTSSSIHMKWTQKGRAAVIEMVNTFLKTEKINF